MSRSIRFYWDITNIVTPELKEISGSELTIPEIMSISERGIGLRWVTQDGARKEMEKGTYGDMIVLSNLRLLLLGDKDQQKVGVFDSAQRYNEILMLLREGDVATLEKFPKLPENFRAAIMHSVRNALGLHIVGLLTPLDSLQSVLEGNYMHHVPSFLLIQRDDLRFGFNAYDEQNYYPFGKAGRGKFTKPDNISGCVGVDDELSKDLRRIYEKNLKSSLGGQSANEDPKIRDLYDEFENTLCEMLTDQILESLRSTKNPLTAHRLS